MLYKVFQVNLTQAESALVNSGVKIPRFEFYKQVAMPMSDEPVGDLIRRNWSYFEHTANIDANSLEGVFQVGNIGPEDSITRLQPMTSVSVGNVIEDPQGFRWYVAPMGFEAV